MKKLHLFLICALVLTVGALSVQAEDAPLPETITDVRYEKCPVMGGKTNPNVSTIVDGKMYHFCCPSCIDSFRKDSEKFIGKIVDPQEVDLTVTNKEGKCPVMGGNAALNQNKVVGSTITFFCCPGCDQKYVPPAPQLDQTKAAPAKGADASSAGCACCQN